LRSAAGDQRPPDRGPATPLRAELAERARRRSRGYEENKSPHAPGHPQSPARLLLRARSTSTKGSPSPRRSASRRSTCPERSPAVQAQRGVGHWRFERGRRARLPERAGHRHRAHRHHRTADGLRHDRHRAGLCAWSSSRSSPAAATSRSSTRASCPAPSRSPRLRRRPRLDGHRPPTSRAHGTPGRQRPRSHHADAARQQGLHGRSHPKGRVPAGKQSVRDRPSPSAAWNLGAEFCKGTSSASPQRGARRRRNFNLLKELGFSAEDDAEGHRLLSAAR
jgi:hypothetical protein